MTISLLHNAAAQAVRRHLITVGRRLNDSFERLASGKRILRSGDDPAGMALSSSLKATVRSVQQAQRNAMDALSLIQVAEGGINEIGNVLLRLRELAVQSSSDTVGDEERSLINIEFQALTQEIDRMAQSTRYLGTELLNGLGREFTFQIGPENTEVDRLYFNAGSINVRSSALGIEGLEVEEQDSAYDAIASLDEALRNVNVPRAELAAVQARLHPAMNNLAIQEETLAAANSRIEDVDLALETTELVRAQVTQRAGVAVLAQANQVPAMALKLIQDLPIRD